MPGWVFVSRMKSPFSPRASSQRKSERETPRQPRAARRYTHVATRRAVLGVLFACLSMLVAPTRARGQEPTTLPTSSLRITSPLGRTGLVGAGDADIEDAGRFVEVTRRDEIIDRWPLKISRVERQQSVRPEAASIVLAIYLGF